MKSVSWIDKEVKKWDLDDEEREILEALHSGKVKSLPKKEVETIKKRMQIAARYTLEQRKKSQSISLRVNPQDLQALKMRAAEEEGIPYQTLITSWIRKYANGKKIA